MADRAGAPDLTIVVPVKDEAGNIRALLGEMARDLAALRFEVVCVDDGSADGTGAELRDAMREYPWLRTIRHRRSCGQSTAILTGVRAARTEWVATIDGDGQNPPAEIAKLIRARDAAGGAVAMVAGQREKRHDSWFRRLSSRIANGVRQALLKDGVSDTGCSLKLFRRDDFLALPYFDHMHRFLPALIRRQGGRIVTTPVGHRPRVQGRSKYGFHNRFWPGLIDLAGVLWLKRRARIPLIDDTD
ncbi:MAG: glycosyltransferase [Alphaproteobacteria bacterium]|nr:glycosyltransferase [Alphaproteobacteria bacterium]